ncbi:carbonic anhydrase [Streptococcus rupicaprae]|uniref:Carbonic anhydrase n=1 Tax=Streptococcus rupicaprae TaxID=759619 RepID=A0ABV2FGR9_9STRE
MDFHPFEDLEASVREDVTRLKESRLIPDAVVVRGAIYDVDNGRVTEVF